jgi:hypothetical protein
MTTYCTGQVQRWEFEQHESCKIISSMADDTQTHFMAVLYLPVLVSVLHISHFACLFLWLNFTCVSYWHLALISLWSSVALLENDLLGMKRLKEMVELCFVSQMFQSECTWLSVVSTVNCNEGTCYNKPSLRIATKGESVGIIRHMCRYWVSLSPKQLEWTCQDCTSYWRHLLQFIWILCAMFTCVLQLWLLLHIFSICMYHSLNANLKS